MEALREMGYEPPRRGDIERSVLDSARFRYWTGWDPRPLKDGLAEMLAKA